MKKICLILAGMSAQMANAAYCANEEKLPNIVYILCDDLGIGDLGCYGQTKIKTPNIDKLADEGILFTDHYSGSAVSAPSRCCLMTGKHTGHSYVRGNKSDNGFDLALPAEEVTVAQVLKQKGYKTMCVGKWGLGGPGTPLQKGFDYFYGYLSQREAHRYYPERLFENDKEVKLGGKAYSHFLIMDKGLDFIRKNADNPFFAYFSITLPHADLDYPDISEYSGEFPEKPYGREKVEAFKMQLNPKATYASMVSEIDRNVGQIIQLLKEEGIWENTIIFFSSDNGVHLTGGHDYKFFNSNGPSPCGRTHVKMSKPMGRSDDMLIIRGVNVFPSQIETVLLNHGYPANYQIIVDRVKNSDTLDVQVEMTNEMFADTVKGVSAREKELVDGLRAMLGLAANVHLVSPKTIERSEGKAKRVIDKRKF